MDDRKNFTVSEKSNLMEWLSAVLICFQYICAAIAVDRISILLAGVAILLVGYRILQGRIKISFSAFLLIAGILLVFLISMIFVSDLSYTMDYLQRFLLYGVVALFVGMSRVDKDRVIKRVIIIGFILLPLILIKDTSKLASGNQMGFSYSCLPVLIASIFGFSYQKKYIVFSLINCIAIFSKFVSIAPRGVWVVIATALVILFYQRLCVGSVKGVKLILAAVALFAIFIGALYLFSHLEEIVTALRDFLKEEFDLEVYALEKYLRYTEENKVMNGRDLLWEMAMDVIRESPIFGRGIGYFETVSGGSHGHNIFLQALCEAGLFFFLPVIYMLGSLILQIIQSPFQEDRAERKWLVLLFCCGVEMMFFSSAYWLHIPFWYYLGSYLGEQCYALKRKRSF